MFSFRRSSLAQVGGLSLLGIAFLSLSLAGCGDDPPPNNGGGTFVADANDSTGVNFDGGGAGIDSGSDSATADTGPTQDDTGTPVNTDAGLLPDTGVVDAGATDTGPADVAPGDVPAGTSCEGNCGTYVSGASCQCDSGCVEYGDCCEDYLTLCKKDEDITQTDAGPQDAGQTDAGKPDAGEPDAGGGDGGGDGGGAGPSCAGKCGKFDSNSSCQCDAQCSQYGDCCKDYEALCAGEGCKADADCDDSLDCTDDKCEAGKCAHPPKAEYCVIENNCYKDGETGDNACQKCDSKVAAESWTFQAGAVCDDGNGCTELDVCNAGGECVGTAKAGCCTVDLDCAGNDPCKTGKCEAQTGTCSYEDKAGCCASGACCDPGTHVAKNAGALCGDAVVSTEYKCDGKQVQKREAFAGCDGKATAICSDAEANWSWSQWNTILTCGDKQTCAAQGAGQPTCKDDAGGGCKADADCDDGNTCTADKCASGSCQHDVVKSCCNFDSDCDDNNKCTIDQCEEHKCVTATLPCEGSSDCETAACDPATGKCNVTVKAGLCKIGDSCLKDGELKPDDSCLGCVSAANASDWSISAQCACKSGVCCDTVAGKIKGKATKCDDVVKVSEYKCDDAGKTMLIRQAFRGCTGASNTCSTSKANYSWTEWQTAKTCAAGETCEVVDANKPGTCKKIVVQQCTPGSTCCDAKGAWASQATKCGSFILKSEFKCSSAAKGAAVQVRRAYPGCTGKSTTCSTSSSNYAWSAWTTYKQCGANDICAVSSINTPGVCKLDQKCVPGSMCCDDTGNYAKKATKCGASILKSKWSCSDAEKGGKVMVSRAYGGCTGSSTTCSYATDNYAWTAPTLYKQCSANQTCSISSDATPGTCKDVIDALCLKTDAYETGTSTTNSFALGSYNDNSATKILNPKVHFKSGTDTDYFKYKIVDSSALYAPKVEIEWNAGQAVSVCAYYQCEKGAGGKNCQKVTCPAGFKSSTSSIVSGTSGNGCCLTTPAAKGTLKWLPVPTSGADKTGWVYFNVKNKSPICQEVDVKLSFGDKGQTACTPNSTCCDAAGNIKAQKSKCGAAVEKAEYKCSSSAKGGDVQVRSAYRGCIGSSAYCSIATSNYYWTGWTTYKNCSSSQVCSVTALNTPGTCKSASDQVCGQTDKYEAGSKSTTGAYNLGDYDDSSAAKLLSPNIHFYSQFDSDYFQYKITDKTNLTNPKVHIEFEGTAEKVSLCAWYRCDKGANGKDCAAPKCPAGTTASTNFLVSGTSPNGCCMTAQKGTVAFSPNAAGTTDETGHVVFRATNAGPICQEVKVKLVFGAKQETQCTPNTTCCTSSGTYATKNTKCKDTVSSTEYKCSSSLKGASVLKRTAHPGCVGSSTYCSSLSSYWSWSDWTTSKKCSSSEVCSVTSPTTPGTCKPAVSPLCGKADPYDKSTSVSGAYNLGNYSDTSPAKFMSPGVHFDSAYDFEYFKYHIDDNFNLTDPKVGVEWTGADLVKVCGYYACDKGAGGKDCAAQKCPAGTTPTSSFSVSSTNPNGCCKTATKGDFAFNPSAAGNLDESGWAYLRFSNASNVCQEVSVKLTFGSQSQTQCSPNTTCCTAAGTYAAKTTKCASSAIDTEYKCSSASQGGDVLVRSSYKGCTGSSTTCSSSSSNKHWGNWTTFKNCSSSQVCSVTAPTVAGTCKTVGSAGPICGLADKYEGGYSTTSAYDLGVYKDSSPALMVDPDVHFKTTYDSDYFKWSIADSNILTDPRVHVEWTASESLEVCAWYRCNNGASGKNCAPVKCPAGTTQNTNYLVSTTVANGCCKTAKAGTIDFTVDAAGTTNETGWGYMRTSNKSQVCQWVNVKVGFGGSNVACGDGKYEGGESSCKTDQGSCQGRCGKYDGAEKCQCDDSCKGIGDCCWDKNLLCDG